MLWYLGDPAPSALAETAPPTVADGAVLGVMPIVKPCLDNTARS